MAVENDEGLIRFQPCVLELCILYLGLPGLVIGLETSYYLVAVRSYRRTSEAV
jgi:hypothetical protein